MRYFIPLYHAASSLINTVLLFTFLLTYFHGAGRPLRRWFLVLLVNAVAIAASLCVDVMALTGFARTLDRILELVRQTAYAANAFLIPYFTHAFLSPGKERSANGIAAVVTFAVIILENAGLVHVSGVLILLAILYALVFSLILLLSRRGDSRPDTRVLRLVFITTACFTPGIILNTLAGDGIITWPAVQSYLGIEVHSVYLAVTGVLLLVMARQVSAPAPAPGAGISERLMADLSEREREVIGHLLQGRANREIAEILYISESTVKKHINSAFRKLGVSSRWGLIRLQKKPE